MNKNALGHGVSAIAALRACAIALVFLHFTGDFSPVPHAAAVGSFTFTAAGDHGGVSDTTASLDLIATSGASFHLALGDLSYSHLTPESAWCDYVKSRVGATFPFMVVAGNHEDDVGADGHINNFAQCLPDRIGGLTGVYGKEFYFDYQGLARIILISPDLTLDGELYKYEVGTARYNWLAQAIDGGRTTGLPWVIVGMHEVCISMGVKSCSIGPDLMNLLVNKRVDLVLQAHEHGYQRSKQIAHGAWCAAVPVNAYNAYCVVNNGAGNAYVKGTGTVFIIVGTPGQGLSDINPADPEAPYFAVWMGANSNPRKGFTKYTVWADKLTAQFVGSTPGAFSDGFNIVTVTPRVFLPIVLRK